MSRLDKFFISCSIFPVLVQPILLPIIPFFAGYSIAHDDVSGLAGYITRFATCSHTTKQSTLSR